MSTKKKKWAAKLSENENLISWGLDTQMEETVLTNVVVGKMYRIGRPSNRYYEHIHPFLDPGKMTIEHLENFKVIHGFVVRVVSILSMVGGNRIAVLRKHDGTTFTGTVNKIFADIDKSVHNKELMSLDLETERELELENV